MNTIKVTFKGRPAQYTFNVNQKVEVGQIIQSPDYSSDLEVTHIYDQSYKYYLKSSGVPTNEYVDDKTFPIKELRFKE